MTGSCCNKDMPPRSCPFRCKAPSWVECDTYGLMLYAACRQSYTCLQQATDCEDRMLHAYRIGAGHAKRNGSCSQHQCQQNGYCCPPELPPQVEGGTLLPQRHQVCVKLRGTLRTLVWGISFTMLFLGHQLVNVQQAGKRDHAGQDFVRHLGLEAESQHNNQ